MNTDGYWGDTLSRGLKVASGTSGSYSMTRILSQELARSPLRRPVVVVLLGGSRLELLAQREVDLAWCIPAVGAKWAFEGRGSYSRPLANLRAVARFPQDDRLMISVAPWCDVGSLREVAERQPALRVAVLGQEWEPDYCMFENAVFARYGYSTSDLEKWGGRYWAIMPRGDELDAEIASRSVDLVIGEASTQPLWATLAKHGFRFLGLDRQVVDALVAEEHMRPNTIPADFLPGIPEPLLSLDESDFLLVTHADLDGDLVRTLVSFVDKSRTRLEEGTVRVEYAYTKPLPVPELTLRSPLTGPITEFWRAEIPLHAAAEQYYREQGYL